MSARARRFLDPARAPGTRLTVQGYRFVILAALLGVAAANTANNFIYLILSMITGMLAVSVALVGRAVRNVRLELRAREPLFAGEDGRIEARLVRNSPRPVYDLHLSLSLSSHGPIQRTRFARLDRRGAPWRSLTVHPPRRGLLTPEHLLLSCGFPFGLVLRSVRPDTETRVLVYPRRLETRHLFAVDGTGEADHAERPGPGEDFFWTRPYRAGDSFGSVHWKTTARHRRLMVKAFSQADADRVSVVLPNTGQWMPDAFEQAVSMAASLVSVLLERGNAVRLVTAEGATDFGRSAAHRLHILDRLALVGTRPEGSLRVEPVPGETRLLVTAGGHGVAGAAGLDIHRIIHAESS